MKKEIKEKFPDEKHARLYSELLQTLKGKFVSSRFSTEGIIISTPTAPHCLTVTQTCFVSGPGVLLKGKKQTKKMLRAEYHRTIFKCLGISCCSHPREEGGWKRSKDGGMPPEGQMSRRRSSMFVMRREAMKSREERKSC